MCRVNGQSGGEQTGNGRGPQGENVEEVREVADEDGDLSGTDSETDTDGEDSVWGHFGVNAEAYKKRIVIWKNKITGKGQKFPSTDAFKYSIWKYAVAHRFDYKLERNCKQCVVVKCKARGYDFYIYANFLPLVLH